MPSEKIIIMEKEGVPADAKLPTEHGNFRIRVSEMCSRIEALRLWTI